MKKFFKKIALVILVIMASGLLSILLTWELSKPSNDALLNMNPGARLLKNGNVWDELYEKNKEWDKEYLKTVDAFEKNGIVSQDILNEFSYLINAAPRTSEGLCFIETQGMQAFRNESLFMDLYIRINIMNVYYLCRQGEYAEASKRAGGFLESLKFILDKSNYGTAFYARLRNATKYLLESSELVNDEKDIFLKGWINTNLLAEIETIIVNRKGELASVLQYQYQVEGKQMDDYEHNALRRGKSSIRRAMHGIVGRVLRKEHELNYRIYIRRVLDKNVPLTLSISKGYFGILSNFIVGARPRKTAYAWAFWLDSEILK